MTATNVSYYAAAFDATGKRVATKICDFNPLKNPKQRAALLDEVKACAASAAVVDIIRTASSYTCRKFRRSVQYPARL